MSVSRPCWSCKGLVQSDEFCPTCGAIQPPDPARDHFDLLGMAPTFAVERDALEHAYREKQQGFHPDRFATRSATERRLSLEQVTRLNAAFQTLKEPLARAEYLLTLLGHPLSHDQGATGNDPAFLMTVMELREELEEVDPAAATAPARLDALRQQVEAMEAEELATIGNAFHAHLGVGDDPERLAVAARHTQRLRYYHRFMEELDRLEEQTF